MVTKAIFCTTEMGWSSRVINSVFCSVILSVILLFYRNWFLLFTVSIKVCCLAVSFIWVKSVYPAEFLAFKHLNKLVVLNVALLLQLQGISETLHRVMGLLTFSILKYLHTMDILKYYSSMYCNTAAVLWCSCCKTIKIWSTIKMGSWMW